MVPKWDGTRDPRKQVRYIFILFGYVLNISHLSAASTTHPLIGPHVCIAKSFAYQEMRYVVARLVLALDITVADNFDPKAFRNGILNMRTTILETPLMVKVNRREGINLNKNPF